MPSKCPLEDCFNNSATPSAFDVAFSSDGAWELILKFLPFCCINVAVKENHAGGKGKVRWTRNFWACVEYKYLSAPIHVSIKSIFTYWFCVHCPRTLCRVPKPRILRRTSSLTPAQLHPQLQQVREKKQRWADLLCPRSCLLPCLVQCQCALDGYYQGRS